MNIIDVIRCDYPQAKMIEETENGSLIQCDNNSYVAVPPVPVSDYETFKSTQMYKFRAFMYYLGSVYRYLNKNAKNGTFREVLTESRQDQMNVGETYCVPFIFYPTHEEQTISQKRMDCPLKASVSSRYRIRYE